MRKRLEEIAFSRLKNDKDNAILWWEGKWLSGSHVLDVVDQCRKNLEEKGFGAGDRLVLFLPNSPLVLYLSLAVWQLGGTVVPLNSRSGKEATIAMLHHICPWGVITSDEKGVVAEALSLSSFPWTVAPLEGPLPPFQGRHVEKGDPEVAVIFATSGTTGDPKAVPLTHSNLYDNTLKVQQTIEGFEEHQTLLNVLPNFHSLGYTICGLLPMLWGLREVIVPSFMPTKNFFRALRDSETNILIAVPTMLPFLLGAVSKGEALPSSLQYILTGGGALEPELEQRVRDTFSVIIYQGYGLTECSPVVSCNPNDTMRKEGTVGPALPGYSLDVRDEEGNSLKKGKEGVLWVKGPSVASGYLKAPELTAERFSEGWFNTGDMVRIDEDGFITILDRVSDMLIVGGYNVFPQEIERILKRHPDVIEAAVIGGKHPVSGEIPVAFVVREEGSGLTFSELANFCKDQLAYYKIPRKICFVRELPLSGVGKVLRRKLREQQLRELEQNNRVI